MDWSTAKVFLNYLCGQREVVGGVGGGEWEAEGTQWSGTLQGILFVERRSGGGERAGDGGFCGKIGPKISAPHQIQETPCSTVVGRG
jgi:hypothetical protein